MNKYIQIDDKNKNTLYRKEVESFEDITASEVPQDATTIVFFEDLEDGYQVAVAGTIDLSDFDRQIKKMKEFVKLEKDKHYAKKK